MSKAKKLKDGSSLLPSHLRSWRRYAWPLFLKALRRDDAPILCGPWRGEVGFESLYWIPFIENLVQRHGIARERLIPIGRGGSAVWYGAPRGMELYGMRSVQQVRVQNRIDVAETGTLKQSRWVTFDRDVVRDAAETLQLKHYHVLHPAWLYHLLAPLWTGLYGTEWAGPKLAFGPLPTPAVPDTVALPEHFVAVRFYARETLNGRDKRVMPFVKAVIDQLADQVDVVLLDHDLYLDDHADMTRMFQGEHIHHLSDWKPETNLALSSAILSKAIGFVGTYGGFAQLALRVGRPSTSFYSEFRGTSIIHKNLMDLLSVRMSVPAYVIRLDDLPMLTNVLPQAQVQEPKASPLKLQTA